MRLIFIAILPLLSACAAAPKVVTQTPGGIAFDCLAAFGGCASTPQQVADQAQAHCQRFGKNAQQTQLGVAPSGNLRASYNCV